MARTDGQGNPKWTKEETILALDLYLSSHPDTPGKGDARVKQLSDLLRNHPFHSNSLEKSSFRNPTGVAFKLQNLRQVATGEGFSNSSKMDRKVWEEFGGAPDVVTSLAQTLREEIEHWEEGDEKQAEDFEFQEGRLVTSIHRRRERSKELRKAVLKSRFARGVLSCDACGFTPSPWSSLPPETAFEVHHIVPIHQAKEVATTPDQVALLCANCHRSIHKAISITGDFLSVESFTERFLAQ